MAPMRRKVPPWTAADLPSLQGRVAVVTGANSGLGYWTARGLAGAGAEVVLACRSAARAAAAAREIRKALPQARLECLELDLGDLQSVRIFATILATRHRRIDLLCNNAGVMALPLCRTRQGFEMQIGINHLGHFALTMQLLPLLLAAAQPRIVNVASQAHVWTDSMGLDDLNWERRRYDKWDAYSKSKLANLLFTFELQRRLRGAHAGALAVAAHPGFASTNLGFAGPAMQGSRWNRWLMRAGNQLLAQPAERGALPSLYAAAHPQVQPGDYIGPDGWRQLRGYPTRVRCRSLARDEALACELWDLSERLTGQHYP